MLNTDTRRSGSAKASGSSTTVRSTVKMAVFAPMHSARVSSAVIVNAFSFQRSLSPKRKSCSMSPPYQLIRCGGGGSSRIIRHGHARAGCSRLTRNLQNSKKPLCFRARLRKHPLKGWHLLSRDRQGAVFLQVPLNECLSELGGAGFSQRRTSFSPPAARFSSIAGGGLKVCP